MNKAVRRALQALAILVVVAVVGFVGFLYWFGRGDLRGGAQASMKADLRNLATAESLYFRRASTFTAVLGALQFSHGSRFTVSEGVQLFVERADSTAWQARVYHAHTSQTCTFGSAAAVTVCH